MEFLYRGVSTEFDSSAGARIKAKGEDEELEFMAGDDQVMVGNSLNTIAASQRNAMHGHNICSEIYKTSFVSFTTDFKVAEKFATDLGYANGYVYVVKTSVLDKLGIPYKSQRAQVDDEEQEVLVNLTGFECLPESAIVEKKEVQGRFL